MFDDQTVNDLIGCLELQHRCDFNAFSIFGLLTIYGWPVDLATVADEARRRRVKQVLDAARQRDIKVLYGLGIYSWGFDEIIEAGHRDALQAHEPVRPRTSCQDLLPRRARLF